MALPDDVNVFDESFRDEPRADASVPLFAPQRERDATRPMFGLRPPLCDLPLAPFRTCQWIDGEPTRNAETCGRRSERGTSWCAAHRARVFRDASASRVAAELARDPHLEFGAARRALRWRKLGR